MKIDVIGDVHGNLDALRALGRHLGYAVDADWSHPDGRRIVFAGDLVDRGPHSLEVAELALRLWRQGRALTVMGNHEYNLVAHELGLTGPKRSNRATLADVRARPDRWAPVLAFLRDLPLAVALPDLRIVHAVWHRDALDAITPALGVLGLAGAPAPLSDLARHVVLRSPFTETGLVADLPRDTLPVSGDRLHAVCMKGYEEPTDTPFRDTEGALRHEIRVPWWQRSDDVVPRDRRTVFGHYWNLPPTEHGFAPLHPSGHERLRAWQERVAPSVPARGEVPVPVDVRAVCVDFNGMKTGGGPACVGAYRHPEGRVAWATA